ncbi:hypothetical protein EB821_02475 [Candidatus Marinimicrobia bacterium PRS2]|nr:hypothetical protein EB821_02475 [Candidatus Marinimicrobia bacterium PRS2]
MMNVKRRFRIIIILLLVCGCIKQSESLQYNDSIITEDVDGYSRDMLIHNDTLFVVNEDEGLLIYKIDTSNQSINLNLIYSDSAYYQNKGWNLSGILFSDELARIYILDKFYCTYFAVLSEVLDTKTIYQPLQCAADNHHSSKFTINRENADVDIFTLIRKVSGLSTSDVSSIYQNKWIEGFGFIDFSLPVIDSLNYDLTDVHYMNSKLVISHTINTYPEIQIYNISETEGPYADTLTLINTINTPAIPKALYSTGDTLFVGMGDHGGVLVYNLENVDNIELISWFSTGFSVREIFWDPLSSRLLLSCGYQGAVVLELDENMQEVDSWILNTSYAYAARNYMGHIIVATRNGLEIINLNNSQ